MFLAGIFMALLVVFFVVPLLWLAPRWGAPYPAAYRRRRDRRYDTTDVSDVGINVSPQHDRGGGWGYWADVLWVVGAVLVIAIVIALVV